MKLEYCFNCDGPTGRAGKGEDSLYDVDDKGPYCVECWHVYNDIRIIENTREARDNFGHNHGSENIELTDKMMKALYLGKCIAILVENEYTIFVEREEWTKTKN